MKTIDNTAVKDGYSELQQQVKQLTDRLKIKTSLGVDINKETKQVMLFAYSTEQAFKWIDKLKAANYKAEIYRESGNVHVARFIMPELKTDSITDNTQRLKTYKIKNHDSGKTYSVKAVSYTDAKRKYNAHIVDALLLVERIGDYTIKKNNDGSYLKFEVFYKGKRFAIAATVDAAKNEIESHKRYATNDSITEDTLTEVQSNKLYKLLSKLDKYDLYELAYGGPSRGSISAPKRDLLDDAFYELVDKSLIDVNKELRNYNLKLDSITEDAVIYGEWKEDGVWNVNTNDLQETKRELKSAGYKYISHNTNIKGMAYKYTVQYTKDSITEDADKSMGTYNGYSIKQNVDGDVYVLKKSGEKQFFESWKNAHEAIKTGAIKDSLTEDEWQYVHYKSKEEQELRNLCSKHNVKFGPYVLDKEGFYKARIEGDFDDVHKVNNLWKNYQFNGVLEDSLTEDAYVYPTNASTSMASSFAKLCVEKFGGKVAAKNGNKYVYVAPDKNIAEKAKTFLEAKYNSMLPNVKFIVADSLTEDADIAQNDIKSTYLPEEANADNIQYLGFNEKRKLSFYGYGDRYFVHYDLEGRTEEVDKTTVQNILKKNILGEIDENDLTNKEPQAEEIISDSKKKQERGDR